MVKEFLTEKDIAFLQNESLKKHCTFRVGGNADFVVLPDTKEKLSDIIKYTKENNIKTYYLGNGSNVIFGDNGFNGIIVKSEKLSEIEIDNNTVYIGAGVLMTKASRVMAENGLSGIECCYGIPGNIGGGLYMNAGAYGGEISEKLISVDYLDENGEMHTISKENCDYSYRHSVFMNHNWFIVGGTFCFESKDKSEIIRYEDDILGRRKDKQPLDKPSAGSSFKRPVGYFAAALIDECGLKGKQIGGAMVSKKHAGFIVNNGNATCEDIKNLAEYVENEVFRQKGVKIEKEMIIVE